MFVPYKDLCRGCVRNQQLGQGEKPVTHDSFEAQSVQCENDWLAQEFWRHVKTLVWQSPAFVAICGRQVLSWLIMKGLCTRDIMRCFCHYTRMNWSRDDTQATSLQVVWELSTDCLQGVWGCRTTARSLGPHRLCWVGWCHNMLLKLLTNLTRQPSATAARVAYSSLAQPIPIDPSMSSRRELLLHQGAGLHAALRRECFSLHCRIQYWDDSATPDTSLSAMLSWIRHQCSFALVPWSLSTFFPHVSLEATVVLSQCVWEVRTLASGWCREPLSNRFSIGASPAVPRFPEVVGGAKPLLRSSPQRSTRSLRSITFDNSDPSWTLSTTLWISTQVCICACIKMFRIIALSYQDSKFLRSQEIPAHNNDHLVLQDSEAFEL